MQKVSKHIPRFLNLDKSPKYLNGAESFYLLNNRISQRNNSDESIPLLASYLAADIEKPYGENYCMGKFRSEETNETYIWVHNTNDNYFIYRITDDGDVDIIPTPQLDISLDPKNQITQFRAYMNVRNSCDMIPGGTLKYLLWIDGRRKINYLDVEAAIATNGFTTTFFDTCYPDDYLTDLRVNRPAYAPYGEWFNDSSTPVNRMKGYSFKFMYRFVYYDGRRSMWSDKSSLYYQSDSSCAGGNLFNAISFELELGNPMVSGIEFAYSKDNGVNWFIADFIEKYVDSAQDKYWFSKSLRGEITQDSDTENCTFRYTFRNDKTSIRLTDEDIYTVSDPTPDCPQTLFRIEDSIAFANYFKGTCRVPQSEVDKVKVIPHCENADECEVEYVNVKVRAVILTGNPYNSYISERGGKITFSRFDVDENLILGYEQDFEDGVNNFHVYVEGTGFDVEMKQFYYDGINSTEVGVRKENGNDIIYSNPFGQPPVKGYKGYHYQEATFRVPKNTTGLLRMADHHNHKNRNKSTYVSGVCDSSLIGLKWNVSPLNPINNEREIEFVADEDKTLDKMFVITDFSILEYNVNKDHPRPLVGYVTDGSNPVEGVDITVSGFPNKSITDFNGFYIIRPGRNEVTYNINGLQQPKKYTAPNDDVLNTHDIEVVENQFKEKWFAEYKLRVLDCDGFPIGGVSVAAKGSKGRVTGGDGVARLRLRGYYGGIRRIPKFFIMDRELCLVNCSGDCNDALPTLTRLSMPDLNESSFVTVDLGDVNIGTMNRRSASLKSMGTYPTGFVVEYDNGQISSVYDTGNVDIPKRGCSLEYTLEGVELPDNAKKLIFVRGENINKFVLQWSADKVEVMPDGNLKIGIQSLNDFNKDLNFMSNISYSYVKGDRVTLVADENGNPINDLQSYEILPPSETGEGVKDFNEIVLKGSFSADFAKEGYVFEINRLTDDVENRPYFTMGISIPVINNQPVVKNGIIDTFDTFYVLRNFNGRQYEFESNAPTDLWAWDADDKGNPFFIDRYEDRIRYGRNVRVNKRNIFNEFQLSEKTFKIPNQNDIVAIYLRDSKRGVAICENGEFTFSVSDNTVRVDNQGNVVAAEAGQLISDGDDSGNGGFGCSYEDIDGVLVNEAFISWISSKNKTHVIHNYQVSKEAGIERMEGGGINTTCNTWFRDVCLLKENWNKDASIKDKIRFHTGITYEGEVFITANKLTDSYIGDRKTIIYLPKYDRYGGFVSFAPECYAELKLKNNTGCSTVMLKDGDAWIIPLKGEEYNKFFDIPVDWKVGVTINDPQDKKKAPLALEIQSDQMWYAEGIIDDSGEVFSEVSPKLVQEFKKGKWNMPFLRNSNSKGGLFEGDEIRGYWINIVLVRDNTLNLKYKTIDNTKRMRFGRLSGILSKCKFIEQSGFTNVR